MAGVLTVGERVLLALREVGLAIGAVEREVELPKANSANTTPTQRQHNANANANANADKCTSSSDFSATSVFPTARAPQGLQAVAIHRAELEDEDEDEGEPSAELGTGRHRRHQSRRARAPDG